MKLKSIGALALLLSTPVVAQWQIDADASRLHFVSTKNAQVTEVHRFEKLSGELDKNGKLAVTVPLSSVNTNIAIRDTRMQEKLFEVEQFPHATFTAQVPPTLTELETGEVIQGEVDGTLELHGKTAPISFEVIVSRSDNMLTVTTVSPTIIDAKKFDLGAGIEALRAIANLSSITFSVPVTFSVTFTQ
ncbi:YceI family protein [Alteromonas sp. ASW11-130]|uniref:YceI family protein n=1 Tax=Alteromonas sp. ASW11-130 TaxID=3015775 RepID=UPI0022429C22|nr:YceI family protein [Alteromonas sp. ASW11-130]MCW8093284.1 YceI family protein [Alteromonas sp. ASW11-130]